MTATQKDRKWLYRAVIMLLLLVNGVGIYYLLHKDKENKKLEMEKREAALLYNQTLAQLDTVHKELEKKKGISQQIDSLLTYKEKYLSIQKKRINRLLTDANRDKNKLVEAQALIAELKKNVQAYEIEIEEVLEKNKNLFAENQQLIQNLDSVKIVNTKLAERVNQLNKKMVLVGGLLSVHNLAIEGVKLKKSGKETIVDRIKAIEKLKISFNVGGNKITPLGEIPLQVRVLTPEGKVIYNELGGSGNLETKAGTFVQYTKQIVLNYQNKAIKPIVYISNEVDQAGTYKVELYQDGELIGQGQKKLN